ncbi:MAG: hypothetical protein IKD93_06165 [Firmicutes bacterium]|nr:hypothetical protein [Bacillota bacterium]
MTIDQSYIQIAAYVVIAVFLLLQWFMSVRPWFIWGLILPLLFAATWYCVVKQPLFFDELGFTKDAVDMMSHYCKLGIGVSLALFAVCRVFRVLRKRYKERKRDERLEAKRMRLAEEYLSATQVAADAEALGAEAAVALESGAAAEEAPLA